MNKYSINLITSGIDDILTDSLSINFNQNKQEVISFLNYYSSYNININECNVDEVKSNKDIEYYFILSTQHILYKNLYSIFQNSELFKKIIKLFLNKNLKIIFVNLHEVEDIHYITKSIDILKSNNIDVNKIFLINNDSRIYEFNKKYEWGINVYKTEHITTFISKKLIDVHSSYTSNKNGKFFVNLNNTLHIHRICLISLLSKNKLLDNINYSVLNPRLYSDHELIKFLGNDLFYSFKNDLNDLEKRIPIMSSNEINRTDIFDNSIYVNLAEDVPRETLLDSYVNITSETHFFSNSIHITEKSFKPFYFYQIPLIFASYQHIKYLKDSYGFDMFDDIVDHSYDNEKNDICRLNLFIEEVKRLNYNKEDIILKYKNLRDRLENNKKIIYKLRELKFDLNVFNEIYNKKI